MDAAFAELAAQPQLGLLHRYESRLHLMYQRALHSMLLLRQAAPPPTICANEPKTTFPCNELGSETAPKTAPNAPKNAPNRPNSPLMPPSPATPADFEPAANLQSKEQPGWSLPA
jgi:hypothetical protein